MEFSILQQETILWFKPKKQGLGFVVVLTRIVTIVQQISAIQSFFNDLNLLQLILYKNIYKKVLNLIIVNLSSWKMIRWIKSTELLLQFSPELQ